MAKKKDRISTSGESDAFGQNPFGGLESTTPVPKIPEVASAPSKPLSAAAGEIRLSGRVELRREKAGRGGKTATTARGPIFVSLGEPRRDALLKELKARLGTGGLVLSDGIEIRGDCREQVERFLTERGAKVVRAGG